MMAQTEKLHRKKPAQKSAQVRANAASMTWAPSLPKLSFSFRFMSLRSISSVFLSRDMAPFLSVLIVVVTLFSVVFCKMEIRRMGYSVLKLTREERKMRDHERQQMIQLAKITRPERLQAVAQARLTLKRAENGQIIQMTERGIAFKQ